MKNLRATYWKYCLFSWLHRHDKPLNIPGTSKRCFIFLAADYANLGDVAIAYAQRSFLENKLPDYSIIEIPASKTLPALPQVKECISPDDIVVISGGGNMSDLYPDIELLRLMVVDAFPNDKVVAFPLTAIYGESAMTKKLQRMGRRIYPRHRNFTMAVRDETTRLLREQILPTVRIEMTPDIVAWLDLRDSTPREKKALFCLRNDLELNRNEDTVGKLKRACRAIGLEIETTDTILDIDHRLTPQESKNVLFEAWDNFKRCSLVVTDRLHGMLFAYITGTPAIVLPNNNHKIPEIFNWIKDGGNITFLSRDTVDFELLVKEMEGKAPDAQARARLSGEFDRLLGRILE